MAPTCRGLAHEFLGERADPTQGKMGKAGVALACRREGHNGRKPATAAICCHHQGQMVNFEVGARR